MSASTYDECAEGVGGRVRRCSHPPEPLGEEEGAKEGAAGVAAEEAAMDAEEVDAGDGECGGGGGKGEGSAAVVANAKEPGVETRWSREGVPASTAAAAADFRPEPRRCPPARCIPRDV